MGLPRRGRGRLDRRGDRRSAPHDPTRTTRTRHRPARPVTYPGFPLPIRTTACGSPRSRRGPAAHPSPLPGPRRVSREELGVWLVVTRWRDEDAFEAWVASPAFAHGHAGADRPAPHGGPVSVASELWSYEVAGGSPGGPGD
ncbi:MAG: antibiotic biosynthesis monooxygenase family protein [Acidimicrobiia bacterium]